MLEALEAPSFADPMVAACEGDRTNPAIEKGDARPQAKRLPSLKYFSGGQLGLFG